MQFGRKLGLPQDMKCSSVKIDFHSHHKLSHQIDFSSRVSISKLLVLLVESFPNLGAYLASDLAEVYDIKVPGKYQERRFQSGLTIKAQRVPYYSGLVLNFP